MKKYPLKIKKSLQTEAVNMFTRLTLTALVLSSLITGLTLAGTYSGGTGEPNNPYQISTPADWQTLTVSSADWGKSFVITADINLAGVTIVPVGTSGTKFTGGFDGTGHIISNVDINIPSSDNIGLFAY